MSDLEQLALAAFIDPLTGLRNRRGLDSDLAQRLGVAKRGGRPLTVVVGDLDGLKEINDRDGHAAGDLALRALGAALESELRAGDTAYRIGGDEFLLLLADTDSIEAEAVVSRVKVSAPAFSWGGATFPTDGDDGQCLMELADHRLLSGRRSARRPRGVQQARSAGTGLVRSGGAFAVATLTVAALLGGVGVGFVAQNVVASREGATTAVTRPGVPAGAQPAAEAAAPLVESAIPSRHADAATTVSAPTSASTLADQTGAATTISSASLDDATALLEAPALAPAVVDIPAVVEMVDQTLEGSPDEAELQQESDDGANRRKPGGRPNRSN